MYKPELYTATRYIENQKKQYIGAVNIVEKITESEQKLLAKLPKHDFREKLPSEIQARRNLLKLQARAIQERQK